MVRILFWVVFIYLCWRVYRMMTRKPISKPPQDTLNAHRFDNVEDADFEDLSNKQDKPS